LGWWEWWGWQWERQQPKRRRIVEEVVTNIRKQEEVLQESYMMIPDSKARLEATLADLEACLDECKEDASADAAAMEEARGLIAAGIA